MVASAASAMDTEALSAGLEADRADADASWLTRSVRLVGRCIIAGLMLSLAAHPFLTGPPIPAATAVEVGGIVATALALWLNRAGRPTVAARVVVFTMPLVAGGLALTAGRGFHDPAILMMPGALILCGVLLDRATLAATTVLAAAASTVVIVAEAGGTVLGDAVDSAAILGITGLAAGVVAGRLRRTIARLQAQEAAARASELRYRSLVEQAVDAIVAGSEAGGFSEVNRRASELSGYSREELLGRKLESLFSPAELQRVPFRYDAIARGDTVIAERMLTRKDGSLAPVEMRSKRLPDGTSQTILRDVSERQRAEAERRSLEARLRQAQKMEAVGRLAGGIAHDFNNLLTALTGSLTLALRSVGEGSPARRWLTEVDKAAWRAASLTRHLLAFSRQQVIEPRVLDLRSVVEETAALVARTVGEDVRLHVHLPDEPCRVSVDRGQMEQVILNLVTNARDAMPQGGLLTLDLGWAQEPGGREVVLSVSDTGQGMSQQVRARIFEPFFTTKPSGAGTGLGLAMVYGAVEQNGGRIEVESQPGRGASFRILLPEAAGSVAAASEPRPEPALHGTETVLLVEDEQAVREVTAEQLESLGYRVLACGSATEGLAIAAGHEGPLHLLLTDVVLPSMDGCELAARLTQARRGLRVLYTSGYGGDVIARHGVLAQGAVLLEKPYSLLELARHVRRALAA